MVKEYFNLGIIIYNWMYQIIYNFNKWHKIYKFKFHKVTRITILSCKKNYQNNCIKYILTFEWF